MSNGRSTRRKIEGKSGRSPAKSKRRQRQSLATWMAWRAKQDAALEEMKSHLNTPQVKEAIAAIVEQVKALGGDITEEAAREVLKEEIEAGLIVVDDDGTLRDAATSTPSE